MHPKMAAGTVQEEGSRPLLSENRGAGRGARAPSGDADLAEQSTRDDGRWARTSLIYRSSMMSSGSSSGGLCVSR